MTADVAPRLPTGRNASSTARLTVALNGPARRRFTSAPTITGRLTDMNGRPIVGAELRVVERHQAAGATERPIGTATTGDDGTFTYRATPGPSRTLTATYRAYSTDTADAARAHTKLVVAAELSLRIRPAKPGRTTWLTGRLKHLPPAGVTLEVQALDGRRWRTFDTTRTAAAAPTASATASSPPPPAARLRCASSSRARRTRSPATRRRRARSASRGRVA